MVLQDFVFLGVPTKCLQSVTAEVASSSLVVPAIFSNHLQVLVYPLVAHPLHIGEARNRVVDRFSDVRQHFFGFHVVAVGNCLGVAESPRGGFEIGLGADGRSVEAAQRIPAELSPRTFCTFAREFSPFTARGCSWSTSDPDTVLAVWSSDRTVRFFPPSL